jgi:hypothetical protein
MAVSVISTFGYGGQLAGPAFWLYCTGIFVVGCTFGVVVSYYFLLPLHMESSRHGQLLYKLIEWQRKNDMN